MTFSHDVNSTWCVICKQHFEMTMFQTTRYAPLADHDATIATVVHLVL